MAAPRERQRLGILTCLIVAAVGCRGVLGIDPLPGAASDAGTGSEDAASPGSDSAIPSTDGAIPSTDGATPSDARAVETGSDAGAAAADSAPISDAMRDVDRAWAAWPLPPVSPPTASYSVTADTVTDGVTKLVWQRVVSSTMLSWQDAKNECDTLTLAGVTDWRLPTRIELWSIVDFGTSSPAINAFSFPNTPVGAFWTISLDAQNSPMNPTYKAWVVDFTEGQAGTLTSDTAFSVRCVRED